MFRFKTTLGAIALTLTLVLTTANNAYSQEDTLKISDNPEYYVITGKEDVRIADEIMAELSKMPESSTTNEMMVAAAKRLLGTPYVAGTLETGDSETLRVYLTKTDCILFVETCMNLALTVKKYGSDYSFEKFANLVRESRYRNGVVRNYSDRIHYTTEWIRQGEARGILTDETKNFGGVVYNHPIFYMSKNFKSYKHLKDADAQRDDCCGLHNNSNARKSSQEMAALNLQVIKESENALNAVPFYYIPGSGIKKMEKKMKSGDVLGYMSGTPGLDIAHVAMVYVEKGKVGFIHASMAEMKVVIDELPIDKYVASRKSLTGIKVMRVR